MGTRGKLVHGKIRVKRCSCMLEDLGISTTLSRHIGRLFFTYESPRPVNVTCWGLKTMPVKLTTGVESSTIKFRRLSFWRVMPTGTCEFVKSYRTWRKESTG